MSRNEWVLLALILGALGMWVGAAHHIEPVVTAMIVVVLMVGLGVVSWEQVVGHSTAFNVLVWFATLGHAGQRPGRDEVRGLAGAAAGAVVRRPGHLRGRHRRGRAPSTCCTISSPASRPTPPACCRSSSAWRSRFPGRRDRQWALLLSYSLGLCGALTAYAAGQNVIYYGSGFISRRDFWVLGAVLGVVFMTVYLAIIVPWLTFLGI